MIDVLNGILKILCYFMVDNSEIETLRFGQSLIWFLYMSNEIEK